MTLTLKKDLFQKNKENKQAFIKMLGKKLRSSGFRVFHTDGDADVLIVKTANEVSQIANTAVVGDDTDLLVLLLYHARNIKSFDIFFHPSSLRGKSPSLSASIQLSGNLVWNCVKTFSLYRHCLDATQSLVYLELEKALH